MYKVLIVDDEPLAREHICKNVNWDKLNLEVCGEAAEGEEALDKIKKLKPEIILLDLNMPLMDGMSLAEFLKENEINIHIIVITGHDEIDFIRKSMKLDVKDYLLKPFDVEELEDSLLRAKKEIEKEAVNLIRYKKSIIYNLLMNPIDENYAILKQAFDFNHQTFFQISVSYCSNKENRQQLIDDLDTFFSTKSNMFFIKSGAFSIVCFYITNNNSVESELGNLLQRYLNKKHSIKIKPLIGISNRYNQYEKIYECYKEALETADNGMLFGEKGIKYYQNSKSNLGKYFYSSKNIENLLMALRLRDEEKTIQQVERIFDKIVEEKVTYEQLIKISNGLMSIFYSFMVGINGAFEDVLDKNELNINFANKKIEDIKNDLIHFYKKSMQLNSKRKLTKAQQIAQESVKLIEENYADFNLSIRMIGEQLHLEESYLRRVFKKEIGKTINDYIIDFRMQKAKELLSQHFYRHSEIATMIGYQDAAYFSKSFKKYIGVSPKEFEILSQKGDQNYYK